MTDKRQGMSTSEAGQKGGAATSRSHGKEFYQEIGHKGGQASGGNFANDPQRAAEAGRKGGQQSGGNFANDPERAAEAGPQGAASRAAGTSPTIGKRPPRQDARVASTATAADARPDRAEPLKRTAHPQRDAPFSHRPKSRSGASESPVRTGGRMPMPPGKAGFANDLRASDLTLEKSSASWKLGRSGTFQSGWAVK